MADTSELIALRDRVCSSPGAFYLLEADARLPFPDDEDSAVQSRLRRSWDSPEDLAHALRGESLSEEQAMKLASEDRARWDALIEEEDRRRGRAKQMKEAA